LSAAREADDAGDGYDQAAHEQNGDEYLVAVRASLPAIFG
jgi:hypothetical protein